MKTLLKHLAICVLVGTTISASAATVAVDPSSPWIGYMNVFDLPQNTTAGGTWPPALGPYQFGSGWGTADLMAAFTGPTLALRANSIGDPAPYWYIPVGAPGAIGNKIMDANFYVEIGSFPGQTLTFEGNVLANSLVGKVDALGNGWTAVAFIKDFAPDYSSNFNVTAPLTAGGFSISLNTVNDPLRHVQYGFEVIGPDVWITDNPNFGSIQIVPEPGVLSLVGLGLGLSALLRRRR